MGELGGFVEEDILHHHAFHRRQRGGDVLGVGVALGDVLALAVQRLEAAAERGLEHVGDAQARIGLQGNAPGLFELGADLGVGDMPVTRQLVREGAHVAGTLHVVLPAQRVDPHTFTTDVAGGHGQVGDAHHGGTALAVLGDTQAVVDGRIAAGGVQARRLANQLRLDATDRAEHLRRILRLADEGAPAGEVRGFAARVDECLVEQALADDDMR